MNILELFEEESDIGIKDPRAAQALKKARIDFGGAADSDLEAFIMSIEKQQHEQDREIDSQFNVNTSQEKDIGNNSHENHDQTSMIRALEKRIASLEKGQQSESVNEGEIDDKIAHLKKLAMAGGMGEDVRREIMSKLKHLDSLQKKRQPAVQKDPGQEYRDIPTHNLYAEAKQLIQQLETLQEDADPQLTSRVQNTFNALVDGVMSSQGPRKKQLQMQLRKLEQLAQQRGIDLAGDLGESSGDTQNIGIKFEHTADERGNDNGNVRAVVYDMTSPRPKVLDVGESDDLQHLVSVMGAKYGRDFPVLGADNKPMQSDTLSQDEMAEISLDGGQEYQSESITEEKVNYKLLARMIAEAKNLKPYARKLKEAGLTPLEEMDKACVKYLNAPNYKAYKTGSK